MTGGAKEVIRELQNAVDANGGNDLYVGFVSMDDGETYGHSEYVATHVSPGAVFGLPLVVITYN